MKLQRKSAASSVGEAPALASPVGSDMGESNAEMQERLAASAAGQHVVAPGESLTSIAEEYTGDSAAWRALAEANPELTGPAQLRPGQVLELPDDWRPRPPEGGPRVAAPAPAKPEKRKRGPGMWLGSFVEGVKDGAGWFSTLTQRHLGGTLGETGLGAGKAADEGAAGQETVYVHRGLLTAAGEGNDAQTRYIHWPHTAASGVTLGKGYDIGSRSAEQVVRELTAAGMRRSQAEAISRGAGLKGDAAGRFVQQNRDAVGAIDMSVQTTLLGTMLTEYSARARRTATSTTADGSRNAAGRERKEGAEAGTYVMSDIEWDGLHPAMVEFLTDLIYQGGYYGWDRVAQINRRLKAHHGDHIAQFKAIRELFVSEDGQDSYMDRYAAAIGEGRAAAGAMITYGDATVEFGGRFRRNALRLAYLDHVIGALESGKDVVVSSDGQEQGATPDGGGEQEAPSPSVPRPEQTDPSPTAEATARTHTVERGETLTALSMRFGVTIAALKAANPGQLRSWGSVEGFEASATITIPGSSSLAPSRVPIPRRKPRDLERPIPIPRPRPRPPRRAEAETRDRSSATVVPDEIQGSVGSGGDNRARDVRIIQQALIDMGWLDAGTETAAAQQAPDDAVLTALSATAEAIRRYQRFGLGVGADGRVDVGGNTWRNLKARLELIQSVADHELGTTPIAQVLADSQWISQFPSDPSRNGAGRGLRESEKAYAGKRNAVCCWDAAHAMTRQGAGQVSHLVTSRLPTLFQDGARETRILGKQAELGVKYIDMQLEAGKPVMIGVDDGRTADYNADQTTEHFVVIVGKVVQDGKISYRFFDPATSWGSKGYSEDNLLEVGEDNASMSGASYSGSKTYRLSQVRQNA